MRPNLLSPGVHVVVCAMCGVQSCPLFLMPRTVQARMLEWAAASYPGCFRPRDQTWVFAFLHWQILHNCTAWEAVFRDLLTLLSAQRSWGKGYSGHLAGREDRGEQ